MTICKGSWKGNLEMFLREILAIQLLATIIPTVEAADARGDDKFAIAGLKLVGAQFEFDEVGQVTTVSFRGSQASDDALFLTQGLPRLRCVCLHGAGFSNKGLVQLEKRTGLTTLKLFGTKVNDEGLARLIGLKDLRFIMLWHDSPQDGKISSEGLRHLARLEGLEVLDLGRMPVTDEGLAALSVAPRLKHLNLYQGAMAEHVEQLAKFRHLTKVNLRTYDETHEVTDDDLRYLDQLKELTELDLTNARITDRGLEQLVKHRRLKTLNLTSTRITDAGLKHIARLPHLEELALADTEIGDAGLASLSAMRNLQCLHLSLMGITDEGLTHVSRLAQLHALTLAGTPVGDDGIRKLTRLSKIRTVYAVNTRITERGAEDLKEALPNCEVKFGVRKRLR